MVLRAPLLVTGPRCCIAGRCIKGWNFGLGGVCGPKMGGVGEGQGVETWGMPVCMACVGCRGDDVLDSVGIERASKEMGRRGKRLET